MRNGLKILHDKVTILGFLKKNPGLYAYLIGDLDDFFWPNTIWFGVENRHGIQAVALLYVGMSTPTLLCFYEGEGDHACGLLQGIKTILPQHFNAHLSPSLLAVFGKQNIVEDFGHSYKMVLKKTAPRVNDQNIRRLTGVDLAAMNDFYKIAYPANWFDSRMLETKKYFGYLVNDRLVGVAGIHVFSEEYQVAAIGNVATLPEFRGQQIGFKLMTALCHDLQQQVNVIGLNVKASNDYAVRCYKKLGFEIVGTYDECLLRNDNKLS